MTTTHLNYESLIRLLATTDGYCVQDMQWLYNYIQVPISQGQYITDEECSFFCTIAFPTKAQIHEYKKRWIINPNAFYEQEDDVWLVDFIARDRFLPSLRIIKSVLSSLGYTQCHWLRDKNGKVGLHRW